MYDMGKSEYIAEMDKKVETLMELYKGAMNRKEMDTARRLEGKIEGIKLARDYAKIWLKEDTKDA